MPSVSSKGRVPNYYSSQDMYEKYDDSVIDDLEGHRRYCCGIFRTKKGLFKTLFLIFLVLTLAIGLLTYFLWPKMPQIVIHDPTSNKSNFGPEISNNLKLSNSNSETRQGYVNFFMNVSVFSPNLITYAFDNIIVNVELLDPSFPGKKSVAGAKGQGKTGHIQFPPNQNVTFAIPFKLFFNITDPNSLQNNPSIYALMQQCAPNPQIRPALRPGFVGLLINVLIHKDVTDFIGFVPNFQKILHIPCPEEALDLISTFV